MSEENKETIYDVMKQQMSRIPDNTSASSSIETNAAEKISEDKFSDFQIIKAKLLSKKTELIIAVLFVFYIFFIVGNLYRYSISIYYLSLAKLNLTALRAFIELVLPMVTWIYSTKFPSYNYINRKRATLYIVTLNALVYLAMVIVLLLMKTIIPLFLKIPLGASITSAMIVNLCRFTLIILSVSITIAIGRMLLTSITNEHTEKSIMHFKINREADERDRKLKKYAYDLNIVRRMDTGKKYTIMEKDRSLHLMAVGTTGTGKTSTVLTNAINNDLDQRTHNEDYQKKELLKLLKAGKVYMTKDFDDANFSANYFKPVNDTDIKTADILSFIRYTSIIAGITAMAPNAAFANEIYEIAKNKGIHVNRVDPELTDGKHKEGFCGFNPYYISPTINGIEKTIEIFSKSTLVADVLQAVFDTSGKSDPYFASVNQNLSTTISTVLLLTYPSLHSGKQPTLTDFQSIINNFGNIKPYRNELIRLYAVKKNPDGTPVMDAKRANIGDYQFLLDTIDYELLGEGSEKMTDQARGLRIIVNNILSNPLIKDALCPNITIDMDAMLAEGQVTVVNYALKLGSAGVAFGMFFMLSFIKAVLRRPGNEKTRIPHFFYVDELPTILHPNMEQCFTLFRQYKCPMAVALQTLDQMDKSPATAYLRGVLVGNCAHQIIFGRTSTSEMEMYQKFAGTTVKIEETAAHTETALSSDNPIYSMGLRENIKDVDVFSTNDIRMKDFQEVTVFSVRNATPVPPFWGKTEFLPSYKRLTHKRKYYNWHKYYLKSASISNAASNAEDELCILDVATNEASTLVHENIDDDKNGDNIPVEKSSVTSVLLDDSFNQPLDLNFCKASNTEKVTGKLKSNSAASNEFPSDDEFKF